MPTNKDSVTRFITEVLNGNRIEKTSEYFHDDMVEQAPFPGQGPGVEGLKEVLRGMRAAFPDIHWTIEEQIAEGDKVVSRFTWTGTHQGPFLGVPATGRTVSVWGMVIDRLEAGKIRDTRILMDALGLMAQLGVFPPGPR
jgi:steroid delta-isomerase-like uncharacterized protein